jgi:hypothetical protein
MNINRHNYEEFLILYMDNELSAADRNEVELFVEKHPDIKEELDLLLQSKIEIDSAIVFDNKENLMKLNDEESLMLYIDNELNAEQRTAVLNFVAHNPSAKKELELLQKSKLQPDAITFPDKESLYRKEEKVRRVIAIRWWQVAAAILLLIGLTIGGIAFFSKQPTIEKGFSHINITVPAAQENKEELATTNNKEEIVVEAPLVKTGNVKKQIKKEVRKEEQPALTHFDVENKNNLPQPRNIEGTPERTAIADVNPKALTNPKENNSPSFVTSAVSPSFIHTNNTSASDEDVAMNEPEKKTKFRGLLRKITRTFEKTTNIKATDEDDRLLVAGLAIRL